MHHDPQAGLPLPADYLAKCATLRGDLRVGRATIFQWGQDPGGLLGRPGVENFWKSLLIGMMDGGQTIILTCDSDGWGRNMRWVYQIARYAEWAVDERFEDFASLLKFLETYPGLDL